MSTNGENVDFPDSDEKNKNTIHQDSSLTNSKIQEEKLSNIVTMTDGNTGSNHYAGEINRLQLSNKQLRLDLQAEQDPSDTGVRLQSEEKNYDDVVIQLRKRLNAVEKQKLEIATQTNEEVAALKSQLAKVRAQIEKGEAARHSLEYELAKSRQEINQIRQVSKNKEDFLVGGTDDLKNKIENLSDEIKHLQKSLQTCKMSSLEQESKLKESLEDKHQQFLKCRAELDSVSCERDKLNELGQQHSRVISDLNDKLQGFENEKRNVLDSLRCATNELTYAKEREDRARSELEVAQSRIKTLEENIETERASHLETKFNAEIVQSVLVQASYKVPTAVLRVRDLEGATDAEKSASIEASKAIERLTQQNRELDQVYEEERKSRKELNKQLDKIEKEHMTSRRQLSSEVDDKKAVIDNLSKELGTHQKNFNELKSELSKAKKRQQFLEDTYGGSIKELKLLLQTFFFDDKKLRMSRKEEDSGANKESKVTNPTAVVENCKHMLIQLKRKMEAQTEELSKAKKTAERLTKELETSKELIKTKDKTIEDTQKNYTKTAKDLNKARSNYAELESTICKLKTNIQQKTGNQEKDRTRIQELSEEIMKLVKRHRTEEEERVTFLRGLHQKLQSSHVTVVNRDRTVNQFSWEELTEVIYEQVSLLVELLQTSEEKLKVHYDSAREKQDTVAALKQKYTEQISRLTNTLRERKATWQHQREDMEKHYDKMLNDLQSRSKKAQVKADQALEKVHATGNIQQGLETEVDLLRHSLAECQVHVSSLLSACALLSGAVYPLYMQVLMLSSERHVLEDLYITWENCRERALYLSSVLRSGKDSDQDKPERDRKFQRKMRPLLRFRVGVITVLAANRLLHLGHRSARCFVAYATMVEDMGLSVSVGGLDPKQRKFTGVGTRENEDTSFISNPSSEPQTYLKAWLGSPELLDAVVTSMIELQEFLHQKNEPCSAGESRSVVSAARSSFSKFLDRLPQFFPSSAHSAHISLRDRSSLSRKLEKQLSYTLSYTPVQLKGNLISSQDLMCGLQNHILDLTQRLHSVEKERRHLLTDLSDLKQQIGDEKNSAQGNSEKNSGKGTKSKYVPMSKMEQVFVELSSALSREQKAQELLQEQSSQLIELTARLDHCASDGRQKQNNIIQLQENLTEAQKELRHKEQSAMQVNKQLGQVQYERDSLQTNLQDAQRALRTATRDKEVLAQYIQNVDSALEVAKRQFVILREPWTVSGDVSLPQLLLDTDLIPQDIGHAGPELIAMQNLLGSFIDVQQQAVSKVRSLQDEIASHREHIDTLKRELSNAVHREFVAQVEEATDGALTSISDLGSSGREVFVPLKEDSEECSPAKVQSKPLISPPVYKSQKSAFHFVKSGSQQTSRKSASPKGKDSRKITGDMR